MQIPKEFWPEIERLVKDLAAEDYAALAYDGRIGRVSEAGLRSAIARYGRTLIPLPPSALQEGDAVVVRGDPNVFAVDVPIWTKEEGRSDLTLSLDVTRREGGAEVRISDLRVQ